MDEILERLQNLYVAFLKALPSIALAMLIFIVGAMFIKWLTKKFANRSNTVRRTP
jgi:ABC-type arginine transport system permease subunit